MGPWQALGTQLSAQANYLIAFLLTCCVLLIALGITKGSVSAQLFHFFGAPNAVGKAWMTVIDVAVLAAPALLVGVLSSAIVTAFLSGGTVSIAVPAFSVSGAVPSFSAPGAPTTP